MKATKTKRSKKPIVLPVKVQQVQRREVPYQVVDDPAKWIHSNKTHRTASEAFRDADYAQSFWRQKTEIEETLDFMARIFVSGLWLFIVGSGVFGFFYWLFQLTVSCRLR